MSDRIDVGLVTYGEMLPVSEDDWPLLQALQERGLRVEPLVWDDPGVDWGSVRLAVIRSPWNYHRKYTEFLAWVERVGRVMELWNRPEVVRWNSHKTYLRDLKGRGVPVIPTVWLNRIENAESGMQSDESASVLYSVFSILNCDEVVVKPVVSLDAFGTIRVEKADIESGAAHLALMLGERDMMAQPYMASVEGYGERSLVYIDGKLSHAVRRSPVLSARSAGVGHFVPLPLVEPTGGEVALADKVLSAIGYETLYARVDMVQDSDGDLRLMELELVEPSLFFREAPHAVERMVAAILRKYEG